MTQNLLATTQQPAMCIYHADCSDGFSAAWAVRQARIALPEMVPAKYNEPHDTAWWVKLVRGRVVYICDFSFDREQTIAMHSAAKKLVVLDHHKTAEAELGDLPFCHFDMQSAGCVVTFKHLFPDQPVPILLRYVEDRDLWLWRLPESAELNAYLDSCKHTISVWDKLDVAFRSPHLRADLVPQGRAILQHKSLLCEQAAAQKEYWTLAGVQVPLVNATLFHSEIAGALAESSDSGCGGTFRLSGGRAVFSLRSRNNAGADVSVIAANYGGGGHASAAGFDTYLRQLDFSNKTILPQT